MRRIREEILEERRRLRSQYGILFDGVSEVLFRHDPAGVNFEVNPAEYESEASTILPKLPSCESVDDVRHIVHAVVVHSFDPVTAGPEAGYSDIAIEIWQLWLTYCVEKEKPSGDP